MPLVFSMLPMVGNADGAWPLPLPLPFLPPLPFPFSPFRPLDLPDLPPFPFDLPFDPVRLELGEDIILSPLPALDISAVIFLLFGLPRVLPILLLPTEATLPKLSALLAEPGDMLPIDAGFSRSSSLSSSSRPEGFPWSVVSVFCFRQQQQ